MYNDFNILFYQEAMEEAYGKCGIPQINTTRWNSTFRQIEAIISKDMRKLNEIAEAQEHSECQFTHREWLQLTELRDILKPFSLATDLTQGDKVIFSLLFTINKLSI